MTTTLKKRVDLTRAHWVLDSGAVGVGEHFDNGGLLLVSAHYGKSTTDYFKIVIVSSDHMPQLVSDLTWAYAKVFGYALREVAGYWQLAIDGGGIDKADEIARTLAQYYGLERVRYQRI